MSYLEKVFENVEWYVVMLSWVTLPLGFFALFLLLHNHYGIFPPKHTSPEDTETDDTGPWHA